MLTVVIPREWDYWREPSIFTLHTLELLYYFCYKSNPDIQILQAMGMILRLKKKYFLF